MTKKITKNDARRRRLMTAPPLVLRRAGRAGRAGPQKAATAPGSRKFSAASQNASRPKGELEYLNPFTLLVAVVLSAQATDAGVNKATKPFSLIADAPQKMLALGEDRLRDISRRSASTAPRRRM